MKTRRIPLSVFACICIVFGPQALGVAETLHDLNPSNFSIPDHGSSVNSVLSLGGAPAGAQISNVKVYYEIKHPHIGDLKVWLTAFYDGGWHDYMIRDRVGGHADEIAETVDNLTIWNGASPDQAWYLVAQDLASGNTGYIDYFELWVDYPASEPLVSFGGRIAYHTYSDYMAAPVDRTDGHLYVYHPDTDSQTKVTAGRPVEHAMNPHFSPDGSTLVFMAIPLGAPRNRNALEVYALNLANSSLARLTTNSVADEDSKFSPDGSSIVWKRQGQVWTMNGDGTSQTRLTFTPDEKSGPSYSPDGSKIVYWSNAGVDADIWRMSSNGSNPSEIVGNDGIQDYYPIYRDAGNILYSRWESAADHHDKIYVYDIGSGTSYRLPLNVTGVEDADAAPVDSTNLVFCSTRSGGEGSYDIYVGDYDSGTVHSLPGANSTHKDLGPSYSPYSFARTARVLAPEDGQGLRSGASMAVAVRLSSDGGIWADASPKIVFEGPTTAEYTGLNDDGTDGDVTASDGVYSSLVALPSTPGVYRVYAEVTSVEPGITRQVYSSPSRVSLEVPPDFDGDGIPDDWETTWCGGPTNCDATVDLDLDGSNYLGEYIADTDPTDSTSVFRITDILTDGINQVTVEFPSSSNRVYLIESAAQITNDLFWVEVEPESAGNGATKTVTDFTADSDKAYRGSVRVP